MSGNITITKIFNIASLIFSIFLIWKIGISVPLDERDKNTESVFATEISKETIIIDAGHGGEDVGAIGISGVYEKNLNMQIAEKLGDYLRAAGYNVVYTRTDDSLLYTEEQNIKGMRKIYDLKNRVEIANSYTDAIFVSIHMNYYGHPSCQGLQVYYAKNTYSKVLAASVQSTVKNTIQPNNKRSIKEGNDIYVLENCNVPAILIECGFISNPDECVKLSEKEYQKELCFSILCGIIDYDKKQQ